MPDKERSKSSPPATGAKAEAGNIVELVKAYAKQETLGPLQGAQRWLMWGAIGATLWALGILLVVIGVLRLVQTEVTALDGKLSWVPYLIALVLCVAVIVFAISRIKKTSLHKESR